MTVCTAPSVTLVQQQASSTLICTQSSRRGRHDDHTTISPCSRPALAPQHRQTHIDTYRHIDRQTDRQTHSAQFARWRQPAHQAILKSICTLLLSTTTIAIFCYQPENRCSFYHPTEDRRLSCQQSKRVCKRERKRNRRARTRASYIVLMAYSDFGLTQFKNNIHLQHRHRQLCFTSSTTSITGVYNTDTLHVGS